MDYSGLPRTQNCFLKLVLINSARNERASEHRQFCVDVNMTRMEASL
jgi:hypothetical protein